MKQDWALIFKCLRSIIFFHYQALFHKTFTAEKKKNGFNLMSCLKINYLLFIFFNFGLNNVHKRFNSS